MDRTKWPAITGLVTSAFLLTRSIPTTFAFDQPVHSSIAILATCAAAILGTSRLLPRDAGAPTHKGQQYEALPLEEIDGHHARDGSRERTASPHPSQPDSAALAPSNLRRLRILFLTLVAALCLRVATLREILQNTQCTTQTWAPLLPLAFAGLDYWTTQRHRRRAADDNDEGYENSFYDDVEGNAVASPYRFLVAVGVLAGSSLLAVVQAQSPRSTYICAGTLSHVWLVPALQHAGSFLDLIIVYCVGKLVRQHDGRGGGQRSVALRLASVGWACLFSAAIVLVIFGVYYFGASTGDRKRLTAMSGLYVWSLVRLDLLVCFGVVCTLLTVSGKRHAMRAGKVDVDTLQIYHIGIMSTSVIATFTLTATISTRYAWTHPHPFPPTHHGLAFLAITLSIISFTTYLYLEAASARSHPSTTQPTFHRLPLWLHITLLTLFLFRAGMWANTSTTLTYHPIDLLMYDAANRHAAYLNQTSASRTLADAVQNYQSRYHRPPPPGFDAWYAYATARNSVIIDDFDSIHQDLLPFWAVEPSVIRERTYALISNPWHDVAGLSIRGGKAAVSPNVVPTHRWMIDGLVEMMAGFVGELPDMDLAFNLNDECRVAVPYEDVEPMREVGRQGGGLAAAEGAARPKLRNTFSPGRGEQWTPISSEPNPTRVLQELSWQRTFYAFGSIGCPPTSPARTTRHWDLSRLCTACLAPHSLGAFLGNWSTAADICHQPDLADLHGLYLSPAAFKAAHALYPVFSQSKTAGFNDILYPSAWNWLEKARYAPDAAAGYPDPPWWEKESTVFWRGATSEGVSQGFGQWRGMARQRFVHMANNRSAHSSSSSSSAPDPLVLLPGGAGRPDKNPPLHYARLPPTALTPTLTTSIHLAHEILRCGGRDCADQAAELAPLLPPTDFQSHWRHRYLLDLDGAGFSGRFLPFLASRSLPLKAGVFREWWADRVTAWAHFVPVDVRGTGFWATVGYFAGVGEVVEGEGEKVRMRGEAHEREGELIAERGREWAGRVLRKEDMEVYFFRLLLEWGRVTDDRREELGFEVEGEGEGESG